MKWLSSFLYIFVTMTIHYHKAGIALDLYNKMNGCCHGIVITMATCCKGSGISMTTIGVFHDMEVVLSWLA